jgi:lysophospholipase L1-like esterase
MKIAFLGASLTEGVYGGSYVDAVRGLLPGHEILNFGVGGNTANRLLARLPMLIDAEPDACFVLPGSNDALAYAFPATRSYYKSTQQLPDGYLEPDEYGHIISEIFNALRLNFIQPLAGLPPLEYSTEAHAASSLFNARTQAAAEAIDAPILNLATPFNPAHIPERPPLTLQTVFQIGDRVKAKWDDYATEQARGGYTYSFDGIHFTPSAAKQAGGIIADWLKVTLGL